MRVLILAGLIGAALVGPAAAQVERLPEQSRAERMVQDTNQALMRQQQITRDNQQTQFEVNQLRQDLRRSQQFPPPGPGRICPPGVIAC